MANSSSGGTAAAKETSPKAATGTAEPAAKGWKYVTEGELSGLTTVMQAILRAAIAGTKDDMEEASAVPMLLPILNRIGPLKFPDLGGGASVQGH